MHTHVENANGQTESCASPSSETIPTTSNPLAQFTSQDSNRNSSTEPLSNGSSPVGAILLGSIIGCTVVAAALAFLIAAAVYKHHKKKHHSHNRLFNKNHTTDGKLFS